MTDEERGEIRSYFKGDLAFVPLWFQILAAVDFDPLRAQEMEENLNPDWWYYYNVAMKEQTRVQKAQQKNG